MQIYTAEGLYYLVTGKGDTMSFQRFKPCEGGWMQDGEAVAVKRASINIGDVSHLDGAYIGTVTRVEH